MIPNHWKQHSIVLAAALLWVPAVGFGVQYLLRYSQTPGPQATPRLQLPDAIVHSERGRSTLLVFVHPQCPCSRATIGELASIIATHPENLDAFVFFYSPQSQGTKWAKTGLWEDAATIPNLHLIEDRNGREGIRFGASTSGQTLLYDKRGQLVFNGGITSARGHAGPNNGRDAILALLANSPAMRDSTPVYGCSLIGEA